MNQPAVEEVYVEAWSDETLINKTRMYGMCYTLSNQSVGSFF